MTDKVYGRIVLGPSTEIVVKETMWEGRCLLQIRKFVTSPKYTGWTKDGIALPIELKEELVRILSIPRE